MTNWERVALDLEREIVRLTKENEELRAALKAQSAEPFAYVKVVSMPNGIDASYDSETGFTKHIIFRRAPSDGYIPVYLAQPQATALIEDKTKCPTK